MLLNIIGLSIFSVFSSCMGILIYKHISNKYKEKENVVALPARKMILHELEHLKEDIDCLREINEKLNIEVVNLRKRIQFYEDKEDLFD